MNSEKAKPAPYVPDGADLARVERIALGIIRRMCQAEEVRARAFEAIISMKAGTRSAYDEEGLRGIGIEPH